MIRCSEAVDSEAFFGSAARQSSDQWSDLDYLIVGDDFEALRARKQWLQARRFSVSDFTWRRLERLISKQTLFSLHLKLEARLVFDRNGKLQELLDSVEPKSDYSVDFHNSLKLFGPLGSIPSSRIGRSWAADSLAVAFRNSAIIKLASNGQYLFSMPNIIDALRKQGDFGRGEAGYLCLLRRWKADYRCGVPIQISSTEFYEAVKAVKSALEVDFDVRENRKLRLAEDVPTSSIEAYARMRAIECELISMPASLASIPEVSRVRRSLLRAVRNPHGYLWTFMNERKETESALNKLRALY